MALRLANRAYNLETERLTLSGPANQMLNAPEVKKAYMGGH